MGHEALSLKCPNCSADLHPADQAEWVRCEFCKAEVHVPDAVAEAIARLEKPFTEALGALATRLKDGKPLATNSGVGVGVATTMAIAFIALAVMMSVGRGCTLGGGDEQARANRYRSEIADEMDKIHAANQQLTEASQRNDPESIRRAQAEIQRSQDRLFRFQQDYLRGK